MVKQVQFTALMYEYVHEQVRRDLENRDRGDGVLDLLLARDEAGDRGVGSGVEKEYVRFRR